MSNEDKIIEKLFEHDKRFDQLDYDFKEFKNQVLSGQDEILTIVRRLDQERIFTTSWISRIEKEVEKHWEEITKIKQALKV
jgi:hypothetical protein